MRPRGAGPGQERDRGLAVAQVDAGGARADQRHRQLRQATVACGRGGVDDQVEFAERGQVLEIARMHALRQSELVDQRVGARGGAIDDEQVADAGIEQRRRHAMRGTTGAEKQCATFAQVDAVAIAKIAQQADAVGVVAAPALAVADQRIDCAGAFRAVAHAVAQRQRGLLQRQGDVGTGAAGRGEQVQRRREILGRGVDGDVFQRDAGLLAEPGLDARRQGMRHRMAEYGVADDGGRGHGHLD